jgi:precorrin-2 C(20)-methyltransferase
MTRSPAGSFWAVGVGPGDPELLTLKAVKLLQRADVVYHAGPEHQQGRAWEIVHTYLRPDHETRVLLNEPMSVVRASDWRAAYRPGVDQIAADCRRGLDIVYITEGDPTLYSTAAWVWQLLAELYPDIPIEIVPAVSSITAAAARVRWSLAQKDEMLAVLPASYHPEDLGPLLERFHTLCLLKPSPVMPAVKATLARFGATHEMVYAENVATATEFVTKDLATLRDRAHYFALLLVRRLAERRPPPGTRQPSPDLGKVWVIGLGPGDLRLLTPEASTALREAEVIIGYERYLRFLAGLSLRAELQSSPIGAETKRAVQALALAQAGRRVALVSSGDAGIYGMASLLLESAERTPEVQVEVVPGVTAASAAAALLGAPLGHDFVCISLSDLLTPWTQIERRLAAAAQGDFAIVLYNPVSQRRIWQLARARDILLLYRGSETPIGLVDKAYRPGQRVWQTTLGELKTDGIGMESLVVVGNSQTRIIHGRMVTPRGYTQKHRARKESALPGNDIGRNILKESFAIIDGEIGSHSLPAWAYAVVRRMIHASADFDFINTLRYSEGFDLAMQAACSAGLPIVADTEMLLAGLRTAASRKMKLKLACRLNDPETAALADATGLTRSAAGIRLAARRFPTPILAIGNAPTALVEAVRLVEEEGWRPAAIVGMPVGFVGVIEAKERLLRQSRVPYLTCVGRKGGSAVTAAALNASLELWSRKKVQE